jgi:hypothetical protein
VAPETIARTREAPAKAEFVREADELCAETKRRVAPLAEAVKAKIAADISKIEVLAAELRQGNRRARRLADDYGFTSCGPQGLPTG